MNFCPYCGNELSSQASFCPHCGKELSAEPAAPIRTTQTETIPTSTAKTKGANKRLSLLLVLCLVIGLAAALILPAWGGNFTEDLDAIETASTSVVKLYMYDYNNVLTATGSGFAAFDKDIIITNHHCIEGDVYSIVAERKDGSTFEIDSVIAYDEEKDIAVLRAPDCGLTPLKTANGLNTKQGETLAAIGNPKGMSNMFSTGVLSKIDDWGTYSVLVSTVSISSGSSGGALFNNHGAVIGITSAQRVDSNEIYISVPIEYAKELYDNRSPEDEMTIAEFYDQSEHPYDVNYLLSYGSKLNGQTIIVYGYVTGFDKDLYLVPSPDQVLYIDNYHNWDLETAVYMDKLPALKIQADENTTVYNRVYTGSLVIAEGVVRYVDADDIRIIASAIEKVE